MPFFLIGCSTANSGSSGGENTPSENEDGSNQHNPGESQGGGTDNPGGNEQPEESDKTVSVSSVRLDKSSLEMYTDDSFVTLTATVLPENATNKSVTWSSDNISVATIDNGKVTPAGAGNATVKVTTVDGNKTAECHVTVKERVSVPNYVLHGLFNSSPEWTDKQMTVNPYSSSEYMLHGADA